MNIILYYQFHSYRLILIQVDYYKMSPPCALWDMGVLLFVVHTSTPCRGYQYNAYYPHSLIDQGTGSRGPN